MKLARRIYTILCDDIRSEEGNKFSLMGVYSRTINLPTFPALLSKLCLCIMMEDLKVDFKECKVTLKCPEAEPINLTLKMEEESQIGKNIYLFAVFSPFRIKTPGLARFEVRIDNNKRSFVIHKFEFQQVKK